MPVFDTTAIIDLTRSVRNPRFRKVEQIFRDAVASGEPVCTTRLNVAEAWVGVERSRDPDNDAALLVDTLSTFIIIDFDEFAARRFGKIEAHLRQIGRPTGEIDTLVAAICLVHKQSLVTGNAKHFADIPALVVVEY